MSGDPLANSRCALEEEELDPRIQQELENLNRYTDEINTLEIKLDDANALFRTELSESTAHLKAVAKKVGSALEKSRPYFDAKKYALQAHEECQKAAIQYQRAFGIHQAAKETILLAEKRFLSNQNEWIFDSAWQEMLNHATIKVVDAEKQKASSEKEHEAKARLFENAKKRVHELEQKCSKSIAKATCYFEQKEKFQAELLRLRNHVQALQKKVFEAKKRYACALNNLENISEEIHKRRVYYSSAKAKGTQMLPLPEIDLDHCDQISVYSGLSSISSARVSDYEDEGEEFNFSK